MTDPAPVRPPNLARWRAGGGYFCFQGHDIFYRDSGLRPDGATLLLLHGFPTASFDWHFIWEPLTKRFRVVTADMLGFGFSAKPTTARYSIFTQADLFEALADRLGIRDAHLLAHDYGDTVAQELLARLGDARSTESVRLRVRSACLLNGGLFPEAHRALLIQKLLASPVGPLIARLQTRRGFDRRFAGIFGADTRPTPGELADYWELVTTGGGQRLFPKLIGYIAERRQNRERWVGALRSSPLPIRFINGPEDPISGAHMAARYRELIPNPDVIELPGIGHYPQHEAPHQVLGAFFAFHDAMYANRQA
jgi:pimeloyl-ACP methyl ester carboxylesterase